MNWGSLGEFLAMGGAGFFVWMSYGTCAVMLLVEVWSVRQRRARAAAVLRRASAGSQQRDEASA
jgi:heme exporter protein D